MLSEVYAPQITVEAFQTLGKITFWSSFVSPRSDIGPDQENPGYTRDPRYFNDYADVSRLGTSYDFCRMLTEDNGLFFACALAGTENLSAVSFRTPNTNDGFKVSHDDYMRDVNGDGRDDYCRILKWVDDSYQPVCAYAEDTGFSSEDKIDPHPPVDIGRLLTFYQGCVLWYRFTGDMLDTIGESSANVSGNLIIDETPRVSSHKGLQFNGISQFLRISDSSDLSVGRNIPLRSLRTWMCWVYFEEFTNNAKIFDFGSGANMDNVFLGIVNKGDTETSVQEDESTVPTSPSGQQPVDEVSPQEFLKTTEANVDCEAFTNAKLTKTATLLYEVWDKQARKLRIKLPHAFPLKKWTHVAITTLDNDSFRPSLTIYINGISMMRKDSGWLPAASRMTNCYLGKSNWTSSTSQYANKDELFKGRLFDFRAYSVGVSEQLVVDSYSWGKEILGI